MHIVHKTALHRIGGKNIEEIYYSGRTLGQLRNLSAYMNHAAKQVAVNFESGKTVSDEVVKQDDVPAESGAMSLPVVQFTPTIYTRYVKPAGDRLAALCALFVFAVPMLGTALCIAAFMGGPILFRQRRVGLNGEVFNVLKFRTMGADRRSNQLEVLKEHRITHKSDKDPRHTPLGRFIRSFSLDELPQLFNVLVGDMSIVGPRPELESVVNGKYPEALKRRHLVRPGLTGLWQISARGEGPMHENGEWDLEYVERVSFATDVLIVIKTPFAMFGANRGS